MTDADRLRVLTFYSAQVRSIQQAMPAGLAKPTALGGAVVAGGRNGSRGATGGGGGGGGGGVSVHTVDGSQGAESDIIVLSFVRSNARGNIGFVADARYARNIHLPMAVFTASKPRKAHHVLPRHHQDKKHNPSFKNIKNLIAWLVRVAGG